MPDQIKSQRQWRFMQAHAHEANPRKDRRGRIDQATAKKILADNPVKVGDLPERVKK